MKNFEKIVHQAIVNVLDGTREDLNLASPSARKALAREIFKDVISEYHAMRRLNLVSGRDDILLLEDV